MFALCFIPVGYFIVGTLAWHSTRQRLALNVWTESSPNHTQTHTQTHISLVRAWQPACASREQPHPTSTPTARVLRNCGTLARRTKTDSARSCACVTAPHDRTVGSIRQSTAKHCSSISQATPLLDRCTALSCSSDRCRNRSLQRLLLCRHQQGRVSWHGASSSKAKCIRPRHPHANRPL
jgi:hypothetical protein